MIKGLEEEVGRAAKDRAHLCCLSKVTIKAFMHKPAKVVYYSYVESSTEKPQQENSSDIITDSHHGTIEMEYGMEKRRDATPHHCPCF